MLPIVRELEADLARRHGTELDTDLLPAVDLDRAAAAVTTTPAGPPAPLTPAATAGTLSEVSAR